VALFRQPRRDGDLVLATMRIFAAPASVELERAATALSLSAERARSERLKTCLLDILRTGKLLQSPSRDILDQLVRPVPDALDVCRAGVWLFDWKDNSLTCWAGHDRLTGGDFAGEAIPFEQLGDYTEILAREKIIMTSDAASDPRLEGPTRYAVRSGIHAFLD